MEKTMPVDKKVNRWLILFACVMINLALGAGYAWSVFQNPLTDLFGRTAAEASLAFSICFAMTPISMIVFGPVQDKYGPKWVIFLGGLLFGLGMILTSRVNSLSMLYISYGVILGFGNGAAYGCTTSTTLKWFPDKKGLAGGLSAAGFGFGPIIFAPLAVKLIETNGVLYAFRTLGIANLIVVCGFALLVTAPKKLESDTKIANDDKKPSQIMKTPIFWLLWVSYIFGCISGLMIIGHASPIAQEHLGFTLARATMIVSVVAISNTVGRLFWGMVSDKVGRYNAVMLMFITTFIGLLLLGLNFSAPLAVLGIMLIALCFGGLLGTFPGITADNWGPTYNGSNYGFMFTAYGIAAVIGPRLAAVTKESSGGSYSLAFLVTGILSIIGLLLILVIKKMSKKEA